MVAAYPLEVVVDYVSVATGEIWRPGVQLASLYYAMLSTDEGPERERTLRNHLIVRLAGCAGEMEFAFRRFRASGHAINRTRWRTRWIRNLLFRNETDSDFAYAALCAWGTCRNAVELRATIEELWRETELLLRQEAMWSQVELLAAVLKVHPVMSGKEAFRVIRPLAP